jgi:hypothetical protein
MGTSTSCGMFLQESCGGSHLEQLRRDTEIRVHSVELREKEWDLAARVRERALTDAREQVSLLMKELATDRAELRSRETRIADLEVQLEQLGAQLATVIARAIVKHRARPRATRPPGRSALSLTRRPVLPSKPRRGKSSVAKRERPNPTSQSARKTTSPSRSRSRRVR